MPNLLMLCKNCGKIFPSGIYLGEGASVTLKSNKSQCRFCGSMESIPDGTFEATLNGFIKILKESKNPLEDAKKILEGINSENLSDIPYSEKIELILKKNKLKIAMAIAILKIFIDLIIKNPDIEINNNIINQQFYNQYNQVININEK